MKERGHVRPSLNDRPDWKGFHHRISVIGHRNFKVPETLHSTDFLAFSSLWFIRV